ncbi:MAG: hypothetical protein HQM09_17600 [Candidatus Riflebacteria bacterium]|nr:hypothetical protein [Candidatus Riflebacteria bacterium]
MRLLLWKKITCDEFIERYSSEELIKKIREFEAQHPDLKNPIPELVKMTPEEFIKKYSNKKLVKKVEEFVAQHPGLKDSFYDK